MKEIRNNRMAGNNFAKTIFLLVTIIMAAGVKADVTDATLEHTGATYYAQGKTFSFSIDATEEHYNNAGGQSGYNGQAVMKFTFSLPPNSVIRKATLTWSTHIFGSKTQRTNQINYMNAGKDLDWSSYTNGTPEVIATAAKPFTNITNVQLLGDSYHYGIETDVTNAVSTIVNSGQNYIVFFVTGNEAGADLYGKTSDRAPSLEIEYVQSRTVTFDAGDNASCETSSLTCYSEGVTPVTLPAATDNNGAEFMGWYTAPIGGTCKGGAGDSYSPTEDITLYAQYDRAPTGITITGESTIKYGTTTTLTANITPGNTVNSGVKWYSGNSSVATIDQNGVVTTKGVGKVNITVRADADPENVYDIFQLEVESEYYGYTLNAVDGSGNVLKELINDTYATGKQFYASIPKYVLVENTLYETAHVTDANYYTVYDTPAYDGYVINRPYTYSSLDNVVYYTEAEDCSAFTKRYNGAIANRTSKGGLAHNDYTYKKAMTLVPGTYKIYAEGSNGNSTTRICDFKVGEEVVFTLNITNGNNNISGSSEYFSITEPTDLYIRCQGSSTSGLDYFYIVQYPDRKSVV